MRLVHSLIAEAMVLINAGLLGISLFILCYVFKKRPRLEGGGWFVMAILVATVALQIQTIVELYQADYLQHYLNGLNNALALSIGPSIYLLILSKHKNIGNFKLITPHYIPVVGFMVIVLVHLIWLEETSTFFYYVELVALATQKIQTPYYLNLSYMEWKRGNQGGMWMYYLILGVAITYALALVVFVGEMVGVSFPELIRMSVALPFNAVILILSYKCVSNTRVIFEIPKYSNSALSPNKMKNYLYQLEILMEKECTYLNPHLKISDVSTRLEIPSKYISQSINTILSKNFYEYINYYRVRYVKELLGDAQFKHLTLLAIAEKAGFQSGTTFNASFKKDTGMLPSKYRKEILSKETVST